LQSKLLKKKDKAQASVSNYDIIFDIFDSAHGGSFTYADLVNFYKLGWSFIGINTSGDALISSK